MSAEQDQDQSGYEDGQAGGPGAPMPIQALEGVAGFTKRDIQLLYDGGYYTVESIAYTYVFSDDQGSHLLISTRPKKQLETIKGISEQKATKFLVEGTRL